MRISLKLLNAIPTSLAEYEYCFSCGVCLKFQHVIVHIGTNVWPNDYLCLDCGNEIGIMFLGKFHALEFTQTFIQNAIPDHVPRQQWSKYLIKKVEEKRKHGYKGQYLVPK